MTSLESVPLPSSPEEEEKKEEKNARLPGEGWTPEEQAEFSDLIRRIRAGEMVPAKKEKPSTTARQIAAEKEFYDAGRTPIEKKDKDEHGWDKAA